MISKVELGSVDKKNNRQMKSNPQNPSFTGMGEWALKAIQTCEKRPMVNVAVLDLSTAILPRTFFETFIGSKQKDENGNVSEKRHLNLLGGFEAFRRESSGLIINCLLPSFIVAGVAKLFKKPVMGTLSKAGIDTSWANSEVIDSVEKYISKTGGANEEERVYNILKSMTDDLLGADCSEEKAFKNILAGDKEYEALAKKAAHDIVSGEKELYGSKNWLKSVRKFFGIKSQNYTDDLYKYVVEKTGISESIKIAGDAGYSTSSLKHLYDSAGELLHGIIKNNAFDNADSVSAYLKKVNKLVNYKSAVGLGVFIIPLAIAAQPINRWITHKMAGKKGAPIYNDDQERILTPDEKKKLTAEKFVAVPLMWAVAALSMLMDRPSLKMFQFKGIFPTMDQARIISAATFSSRIAASEDSNELKENTIRDIATFSSFYFLGDYAAKGIATYLENHNKEGIKLINKLKQPKPNANALERFWAWAKHTKMKSSDELMHIADDALRSKARNMRAFCQLGNLVFSLISLGIFIPLYTRTQTNKKKQQEREKLAAMLSSKPPVQFTQRFQDTSPAFQSFSISNVQ